MKKVFALLFVSLIALVSKNSRGDDVPKNEHHHRWVGVQGDLGVPEGISAGAIFSPYYDWLKVTGSVTSNYFAWGGRIGATVDPVRFMIAPTGTIEYGATSRFDLSRISSVTFSEGSFNYVNFLPGIEMGSSNRFRFFVRAGATRIWARAYGYTGTNNLQLSDPRISVWLLPTFKVGFTVMIF